MDVRYSTTIGGILFRVDCGRCVNLVLFASLYILWLVVRNMLFWHVLDALPQ
jgi:hypothetical protein